MEREVAALRAERDELKSWRVEAKRAMRLQRDEYERLEREVAALREERDEMERRYINAHDDGDRARKALHDERCEVAALREALSKISGNQEPSYVREVARAALAAGENPAYPRGSGSKTN